MAEITDIDRRVSQGMRLLDDKRPGWEERIILDRLDMANFTQCVVAQVVGHCPESSHPHAYYLDGLFALGISSGVKYGFDRRGGSGDCSYSELTQAWTKAITARREGKSNNPTVPPKPDKEEPPSPADDLPWGDSSITTNRNY
jgi:hypothetical protein